MTRGRRDFTSVTQTVATKYEVLCEHKVAAQAREMLQTFPVPGPAPSSDRDSRRSRASTSAELRGITGPDGGHPRLDVGRWRGSRPTDSRAPSAVTRMSSSMRTPMPRTPRDRQVVRLEVQARLDGQHHARLQRAVEVVSTARLRAVVHVHAEMWPVPCTVQRRCKPPSGASASSAADRQQAPLVQALGDAPRWRPCGSRGTCCPACTAAMPASWASCTARRPCAGSSLKRPLTGSVRVTSAV